jgi:hypothetical protein
MTIQLTPAECALLQGVAIPDLPVGALPSIKLLQTNSPELLDSPLSAPPLGPIRGRKRPSRIPAIFRFEFEAPGGAS